MDTREVEYLSGAAGVEYLDPRVQEKLSRAQSEAGFSCSRVLEIQGYEPFQEDEERVLVGICSRSF